MSANFAKGATSQADAFETMAERFTNRVQFAADWKHGYFGAAYSTRIKQAIAELKEAIAEAEQHPEIKPAASPMARYRKKLLIIEAWQNVPNASVPKWFLDGCNGKCEPGATIKIATLEGIMEASPGDWIIKGIKGEIYPCKPDIFAASYDPV